jgi:hypothetical protein
VDIEEVPEEDDEEIDLLAADQDSDQLLSSPQSTRSVRSFRRTSKMGQLLFRKSTDRIEKRSDSFPGIERPHHSGKRDSYLIYREEEEKASKIALSQSFRDINQLPEELEDEKESRRKNFSQLLKGKVEKVKISDVTCLISFFFFILPNFQLNPPIQSIHLVIHPFLFLISYFLFLISYFLFLISYYLLFLVSCFLFSFSKQIRKNDELKTALMHGLHKSIATTCASLLFLIPASNHLSTFPVWVALTAYSVSTTYAGSSLERW